MASPGDVARMNRIIGHLKAAGVVVREIDGWRTRGRDWTRTPVGVWDHHDASTVKSGEWGGLGVITYGRSDVPGPLSQFQVARCLDGVPKVAIVAAGRANHAGRGGPLGPIPQNSANSWVYGAEKANNGLDEPYTPAANYAADALFWAVLKECAAPKLLRGHREWAPGRKTDPRYSMTRQREQVAGFRPGWPLPASDGDYGTVDMRLPVLGLGSEGPIVGHVQRALGITADGKFGPTTLQAVGDFHVKQGWPRGDQVGGDTYRALGFGAKV